MSVEQARKNLNQLDKELADLEKKLATEMKKEADKTKRINDAQKSITKNTSVSIVQSKMRQIGGYQNDLVKVAQAKADINKKIAEKRKKRGEVALKLQKEELSESKKFEQTQKRIYSNYESRIAELSSHLSQQTNTQQPPQPLYTDINFAEEYDVFVSHASEDKATFADELCNILTNSGIKVWYDAMNIQWGDSLRSKIDEGLKKSKYGIVIISKDYIKKGWTNYELDALFQREMTGGKTILPIWHNITKKEVEDFSLTLAGRLALNTTISTPIEIAEELKNILEFKSLNQEDAQNIE